MSDEKVVMKGYKAFNKGMKCRDKLYTEYTVFEEDSAEICKSGMHFCKNPLDTLDHYPLLNDKGEITEFAEVEALDEVKTDDYKVYCTKKLKIGEKLDFAKLVQASVSFDFEKETKIKTTSRNSAQIGSSGNSAKIGSSGYSAQIGSSGDYAVICCAGHGSIVKAKKGSWITLSEWKYDDKKRANIPVCVKTEYVDGEKIKEDTLYKLENGEFVEVEK